MRTSRTALLSLDPTGAIARAIDESGARPGGVETVFEIANHVLDGYGVEELTPPERDILAGRAHELRYVNLGEAYEATLMRIDGRWAVGSWGDVVERHPRWFA